MKYTQEQFNQQVYDLYPEVTVTSVYTGMRQPIAAKCNKCGHEWSLKQAASLIKSGCPKCSIINKGKAHRLSQDEFIKKLEAVNINIIPLDKYVTAKEKIRFKCSVCNSIWEATPDSVLKGSGCPKCAVKRVHSMQKLSQEEVVRRVNSINPNIILLDKYINSKTSLQCYCKKHKLKFTSKAQTVLSGTYICPECKKEKVSEKQMKSNKEFINQLKNLNICVLPLEDYKGSNVKIAFKCLKCGYIREAIPSNVIAHNGGCPKCAGQSIKSLTDFIIQANIVHNNKYLYSKAKYLGRHNKTTIICPIHGDFEQEIGSHLSGCGCSKCNQSKGEQQVQKILESLNISFSNQFKIKNNQYFANKYIAVDFQFKYNEQEYFIEYNGKQHYEPIEYFGGEERFKKQVERDNDLRQYCKDNNIRLLEIKYTEDLDNMESIIKNFISYVN